MVNSSRVRGVAQCACARHDVTTSMASGLLRVGYSMALHTHLMLVQLHVQGPQWLCADQWHARALGRAEIADAPASTQGADASTDVHGL